MGLTQSTIAGATALALCALVLSSLADAAPLRRPQPSISIALAQKHAAILASDAFEGRAPLTDGEERTVSYIAKAMAEAGLHPGNGSSWFQDVPLVEITASPKAELHIKGSAGELDLRYHDDMMLYTRRPETRVKLTESDIVFVGYGINAPERGWNDYAGVDVRGKTVLILINDPDWAEPAAHGPFGGRRMTYYGRWSYKYEEAARQGAAAALIIHDTKAASYPFQVLQTSLAGASYSLAPRDGGASLVSLEGWLTKDAATRLVEASGRRLEALEAAAKQPGFRAIPLGLKASATLDNRLRFGRSRNVIGILPGRERPDEYVLYTAHWDHLGRCPADATGDNICNGAVDNASGVAGILALADAHRRLGPAARSIVFMATTGEEYGLLGSQHYANEPVVPLGSTVAAIDIDPLNVRLGRTSDVMLVADQTELSAYVRRAAAAQGRVVVGDSAPELGNRYRSDTLSFARAGIPIVYAESGMNARDRGEAWGKAQTDRYYAERYHQPADEYDSNWNWDGALDDLELHFRVGRDLADGSDWPNWYRNDEFRAARDRVRPGS